MAPTGETIAAMTTRDMAFANDQVTFGKTFHMVADAIDHSDKLVPYRHRDGDGVLGPGVPVIYMYVRSADGGLENADQDVVARHFGHGDGFEPQSRLGFRLHHRLHRFLRSEERCVG